MRAYRAVIASSVGIFLNPFGFFGYLSSPAVSCASLSTFSTVSCSPGPAVADAGRASPLTEPLVELGGEVDSAAGDVERVTGALTAVESAKDVVVEREVWEPVRRREAARRGRFAANELAVWDGGLALMRAASWLREGRRPAEEGLSAFEISGRSGLDCEAADEFAFMARSIVMAAAHKGQPLQVTGYLLNCLIGTVTVARFIVH